MENLRLNSPNPYKVRRFSQLPAKDTLHILKQCTPASVKISISRPLQEKLSSEKNIFRRSVQGIMNFLGFNGNE
jgi:hypothetical protein